MLDCPASVRMIYGSPKPDDLTGVRTTMADPASTENRPAALARASVSPTHFSALTVDGIGLDAAIKHYLNW